MACGFELVGVTPALPLEDFERFADWRKQGRGGEMTYLTDRRGDLRSDPRSLLPSAQSMVCVGKLYNTNAPHTSSDSTKGWISRYGWGGDYHQVLRRQLEELVARIAELHTKDHGAKDHGQPFESRICVDTAPLLERSYARAAGLGWVGKNTCLINQESGSWFFLGELLLSIPLDSNDRPPADRCGTCSRCIDACPTAALVPGDNGGWNLDAPRCISYLTIENRGPIAPELAAGLSNHIFGCDICQDVCPWNRQAPVTEELDFAPAHFAPPLDQMAALNEEEFRALFRHSPIRRAKYRGFLRNVAHAIGNSRQPEMRVLLESLLSHADTLVADAARQALGHLDRNTESVYPGK